MKKLKKPKFLFIEPCDFQSFPSGGKLSFAKQMLSVFGNKMALVGIDAGDFEVGKWGIKNISGQEYYFFSMGHRNPTAKKPIIPDRIKNYYQLSKHKNSILSLGISNAFIESPEVLFVAAEWGLESICYRFAGVENPLKMPRYTYGKYLTNIFDRKLFAALNKTNLILASADEKSVDGLIQRSRGKLLKENIIPFHTRVDTNIFHPCDQAESRRTLGVSQDIPIIVNVGRINRVKGWELILDSFNCFCKKNPETKLIFVGDGEDREQLEQYAKKLNLNDKILITGFKPPEVVALYINASDIAVVGSHKEGWSIAMIEALTCGKAIVTTDVSGAEEMVVKGKNGFVVKERNPDIFAEAMINALNLPNPSNLNSVITEKFSLNNLEKDLSTKWCPISNNEKLKHI